MAAQVVRQTAQRQWTVTFEHASAPELILTEPGKELDGLGTGLAKNSEGLGCARCRIRTLFGERLAVDRDQRWVDFFQHAAEAHVITLDLNVANMADLFDRGER